MHNEIVIKSNSLRTILISIWLRAAAGFALCLPLTAAAHDYVVTVAADLDELRVEARFETAESSIRARVTEAGRYIREIRDCDTGHELGRRDRRLVVPRDGIRCLSYRIDLGRIARAERRNANLADDNIVVSPTLWLWRPRLDRADGIDISFVLPDGMRVSVPWQQLDAGQRFRLTTSPRSGRALMAIGRFHYREIPLEGTTLRVAMLEPSRPVATEPFFDWVRDAAANVVLTYGRFPNPSPQVLILPVGQSAWDDSAVLFGRVLRDGGEAIELLVNERQPIAAFNADWTATHEFAHLLHPYVTIRQRWVSEGFAQYYQNVLMARGGMYSRTEAWQKLYEGFERGRNSRPELSPNEASERRSRDATMKIYWSGAVLALMADVELRRRSGGEQSLDTVLDDLQTCCLPSDDVWSGRELFAKLDAIAGESLFVELYDRYADEDGFPDYLPLFDALGISVEDGRVSFDDGELARVRDAITVY